MSTNLIELANEYFSDLVIEKISSSLGFDSDTATQSIGQVFPSLLGAFVEKAETLAGTNQLFEVIKEADNGLLDNLSDVFSGDNTEVIDKGSDVLNSLLGKKKVGSLLDIFGTIPEFSSDKEGKLMGLLTPILIGMLSKQVETGGLDSTGIAALLDDQKGHVSDYLGEDFTKQLGFGSFLAGACSLAGNTVDSVKGASAGLVDSTSGVAGDAVDSVKGLVGGEVEGLGGALNSVKDTTVSNVSSDATNSVKALGAGAVSIGAATTAKEVAGNVARVGDEVSRASTDGAAMAEKGGGGLMKILPLLALVALAFVGFKMFNRDDEKGVTASNVSSSGAEVTSESVSVSGSLTDGSSSFTSDSGVEFGAQLGISEGDDHSGPIDLLSEAIEFPSFIPTPDTVALSEKATALAQKLTRIQIPESADIDELYTKLNAGGDSNFMYRITFATGEIGVPEAHRQALIQKLQSIEAGATLVTVGYADTRGDDALNKKLSYNRAQEVGAWIKTRNDVNLESFSIGETDRFNRIEVVKNRVVEIWQLK